MPGGALVHRWHRLRAMTWCEGLLDREDWAGCLARQTTAGDDADMALPKLNLEGLTPAERLALIERIWDSLDSHDVGLTQVQEKELVRRLKDMERHPDDTVSWPEARRRIQERKR